MTTRTRKPKIMGTGHSDDFQTPPEALEPLLPHVCSQWRVWEPAAGQGLLAAALAPHVDRVIETDILTGQNFLTFKPEEPWDAIITNPPYSLKEQFLERAYLLGQPFAFLLPLTTFDSRKRQAMFRHHGVQVIFMPKRIAFHTPSGRPSSPWLMTAWFLGNWGLERDLVFWTPNDHPELDLG